MQVGNQMKRYRKRLCCAKTEAERTFSVCLKMFFAMSLSSQEHLGLEVSLMLL